MEKSSSSSLNSDVVKLQLQHSTEPPLLFTSMMTTHHQETNLDRPFGGGGDDDGGGGGGGPTTTYNSGGASEVVGNIYSRGGGGENFATSSSTNLQLFDIFSSYPNTPYKSPGMGFPFTCAQWKELERQAMIYRYMISSVPVPPDLLFPLSRNFPTDSSVYNVRYTKNGDPEPGRCKRTDGKKWRCSRDVAPHQKYCERHLHRGRPRSRKPVEVKKNNNNNGGVGENNKKTRVEQIVIPKSTTSQHFVPAANEPLLLDLSLMMETENRWHQLMEPTMGYSNQGSSVYGSGSPIFHQDYIHNQPLNLFSYPNFPSASEIEAPIGFIDAWSIDNLNNSNNGNPKSSVSPNDENLSTSLNLSVAMAAGNILDEGMGNIQMGNSFKHCDDDDDQSSKDSRWLCPVSWEPFAKGGPLAEALQPGSAAVGCTNLGPPSPHDSISNTATTVSSPSGVIQRTLFSNSDGSVCNSPTVPSEVVFQWLN
ncbi:hypothetical protein BUALT_Bualt06G0084200 [Buddleja alternifolia]|uniref:Growth-regulating factor n=1 Tax=Buddleja alternifolia TaxID=168488 RepID=A0AAV6XF80_9LAMI|nr:hypothetical protein BUALT_Bualt06G0084200 [Buddleja alternifolia]